MSTAVATVERPGEVAKPPHFGTELAGKVNAFSAALPKHIPQERFARVIMTAVQRNPDLLRADRQSLWNSSMQAAADGLLPDGREGALVVYNTKDGKDANGRDVWIKKVQWLPMIAGIRKKVRNSGEITVWNAEVVHAKDAFEYELGDDPFIRHKPSAEPDPGPVIAAYSVATLKGGEKSREVMTRAQLDKVRAASKSPDTGPWKSWFEEMCRKTVAKRHAKVLPMSTDLDDLMRRDDELYDLKGASDRQNGSPRLSLAGKLDALAAGNGEQREQAAAVIPHDHVTGEIQEQAPAQAGGDEIPAARGPGGAPQGAGDAVPQGDHILTGRTAAPQGGQGPNAETQPNPAQQDGAEAGQPASASDPKKEALMHKLRAKAKRGARALSLAIAGLPEDEQDVLTDTDHEELGKLTDQAEKEGARP